MKSLHLGAFHFFKPSTMKKLLFPVLLLVAAVSIAQNKKPNIVFIMADDMGFSDIGSYGAEIQTPNLDKLAGAGVRLKQFYNTGRCCPTRASLLTGQYSHNVGMGYMTGFDQETPGYLGDLNKQNMTIAEALKMAGYSSYMAGKWHVSSNTKPKGPQDNWPLQRGFDRYFGTLMGSGSYFKPKTLMSGNAPVKPEQGFYLTDAISDSASKFIKDHIVQKNNAPFFLYVAYTAPHWPLHAKEQDIEKYSKLYQQGWDSLRLKRYKKQIQLGVLDPSYALSPREDSVPAWKDIPASEKAIWVKRMAIYAAQVDCMDQGIGKIISTLKENKVLENTMVVFVSDNGGCAEYTSTMDNSIEKLGTDESYESYRGAWANLSNTPFRLYKTRLHEGGIHAPCIISWPGHTPKPGAVLENAPVHIIDMMPSFLEMAGVEYPNQFNHNNLNPINGRSFLPILQNKQQADRVLYWEHQANRAIRIQDWKLVSKSSEEPPYIGNWELYDLKKDRTEKFDLALKYPEKVKELEAIWNKWANANHVFPLIGSDLPKRGQQFKRVF